MGLYNFKERFVPLIKTGEKTHTLRATRRHPDVVGSMMYLYCGLRTKNSRLIFKRPCVRVQTIEITSRGQMILDGEPLDASEREALAASDGFDSHAEMMRFWQGRLPFAGHVYHWEAKP